MKITVLLTKLMYYYQYIFLSYLCAGQVIFSVSAQEHYQQTFKSASVSNPNSVKSFRGTGPNNVLQRTSGDLGPAGFNIEVELGGKKIFCVFPQISLMII